jgi:elongation factor Tu
LGYLAASHHARAADQQVRELLSLHDYPGDDIPFVRGSALCALEVHSTFSAFDVRVRLMHARAFLQGREDAIGKDKILELMMKVKLTVVT